MEQLGASPGQSVDISVHIMDTDHSQNNDNVSTNQQHGDSSHRGKRQLQTQTVIFAVQVRVGEKELISC